MSRQKLRIKLVTMAVTIPLDNLIFDSTENIFTPTCKNNNQQVISIKSQVNFILKSNNFR